MSIKACCGDVCTPHPQVHSQGWAGLSTLGAGCGCGCMWRDRIPSPTLRQIRSCLPLTLPCQHRLPGTLAPTPPPAPPYSTLPPSPPPKPADPNPCCACSNTMSTRTPSGSRPSTRTPLSRLCPTSPRLSSWSSCSGHTPSCGCHGLRAGEACVVSRPCSACPCRPRSCCPVDLLDPPVPMTGS
jgi:hypothetical protein